MTEYTKLRQLGMSNLAVACYESLFKDGGTTATKVSERLQKPRTGLYRLFKELEAKGFVTSRKAEGHPTYFFAQRLDRALENYNNYQRRLINELIQEQKEVLAKRSGT